MNSMTLMDALDFVEAAPRGNARLQALETACKADPRLTTLFQMALNPYITYGVQQFETPVPTVTDFPESEWYAALKTLADALRTRTLSGNAARDSIESFLRRCSRRQQVWSARILRKDLRLDIGVKAVNKALGKGTIPEFGVPLATDWSKVKALDGKWALQPKLDGARCLAYLPPHGGDPILYTRTGKTWENFGPIFMALKGLNRGRNSSTLGRGQSEGFWLDGEVVVLGPQGKPDFQALQHILFAETPAENPRLHYYVFSLATDNQWQEQKTPYLDLYNQAQNFLEANLETLVSVIDSRPFVISRDGVAQGVTQLMAEARQAVAAGYEGIMLRREDHRSTALKRTQHLLKVKFFQDAESKVIDFQAGTGKYEDSLGALLAETQDGKVFGIGSGFSDEERMHIWSDKEKYRNRQVSYKYQELTEDGIPRFPVFRGFRDDTEE